MRGESYQSPIDVVPAGIVRPHQIYFENGLQCYIDDQGYKTVIVNPVHSITQATGEIYGENTTLPTDVLGATSDIDPSLVRESDSETPMTVIRKTKIIGTPSQIAQLERMQQSTRAQSEPYARLASPDRFDTNARRSIANQYLRSPVTAPVAPYVADAHRALTAGKPRDIKIEERERRQWSFTKGEVFKRSVAVVALASILYNAAHFIVIAKDAHNIKNTYTDSTPFFGPAITSFNEMGPLADDMFNPTALLKLLPGNK